MSTGGIGHIHVHVHSAVCFNAHFLPSDNPPEMEISNPIMHSQWMRTERERREVDMVELGAVENEGERGWGIGEGGYREEERVRYFERVKQGDEDRRRLDTDVSGSYVRLSQVNTAVRPKEEQSREASREGQPVMGGSFSSSVGYAHVQHHRQINIPQLRSQPDSQSLEESAGRGAQGDRVSDSTLDDYVQMDPDYGKPKKKKTFNKYLTLIGDSFSHRWSLERGKLGRANEEKSKTTKMDGRKVPADYEHPVPSRRKGVNLSSSTSGAMATTSSGDKRTRKKHSKYINVDIVSMPTTSTCTHTNSKTTTASDTLEKDSKQHNENRGSLDVGDVILPHVMEGVAEVIDTKKKSCYVNIDADELPPADTKKKIHYVNLDADELPPEQPQIPRIARKKI